MDDEDEVTRKAGPVGEMVIKVHTDYGRHHPRVEDMRSSVRAVKKARNACMIATKAGNVVAPTKANEVVRGADAVFKGILISKVKIRLVCGAGAPAYPNSLVSCKWRY